jgi:hypothetical protein
MAGEVRTHDIFIPNQPRPLTMGLAISGGLSQTVNEAEEQTLVHQLVAHPAIERLREPVLRRLAWRDVMPGDALPRQDRRGGELRASAASQYNLACPASSTMAHFAQIAFRRG